MLRSREFWRALTAPAASAAAAALAAAAVSASMRALWISVAAGMIVAVWCAARRVRSFRRARDVVDEASRLLSGQTVATSRSLEHAITTVSGQARQVRERIDDLTRRETELSRNSTLLQTVLETMIEGVIVVDGAEQLVYANPAARQLLDLPLAGMGRPLLEVIRSPGIAGAFKAALRAGQVHRTEFDLRRKERAVAVTAAPLGGSAASGAVLVLHDVTELRRLERMRRDFVSNVSHELKTPLTHIQAYADTLADGAFADPEHSRTFLNRIIEQAERLQTLIGDLLQLARIESQPENAELAAVDLSAGAARCVEEHQALAAGKGLALTFETSGAVHVLAEQAGIQQILENLVDNALKYTPAGGSVGVTVRESNGWGVLEVADTGIGIPKEEQSRVFERFYRVDRARSRAVGGTGLGLSIVKHLVQQYQGRIELISEMGRGSRFIVQLRIADPHEKTVGEIPSQQRLPADTATHDPPNA